jgi:hypothetical protein
MQYLHYNNLKLPLYETANSTFWCSSSVEEDCHNFLQLQDVPFLEQTEVTDCFNANRIYGLVGVLARNFVPFYYLVIVPRPLSVANVCFIPKSIKTGNLNKNVNDRNTLYGSNFSKHGQFATATGSMFDLFLTKVHESFSGMKLFRKQNDYICPESFWDSFVFDKPMVEVLSKKKDARAILKRKQKNNDLFCEDSTEDTDKKRSTEPRPESHVLPYDMVNLLNAEKLNTNDKVPVRNSIKSRDSGGLNHVVSAVEQQSDSTKIYLSDYHIATEVENAYSTVHNQSTILAAKKKLECFLNSNGHAKGSKLFDKAIGAVSDKYFEGIEHRMESENPLSHKFTDIKLDIDQVVTLFDSLSVVLNCDFFRLLFVFTSTNCPV